MKTETRHPLVSVVIPTYNAPSLLLETLQTVFAQTFADFEVVIVNDGSTDDTAECLRPLAKDAKIRLINQPNGGIGKARNRGMDEARGKYIALLDHDDLWKPGKLAAQVAFAEAHSECSIVSVPWSHSTTPDLCVFSREIAGADGVVQRPLWHMARGATLFCSSSMMIRNIREDWARYGEKRRCIEDQQVHLGLLGRGKLGIAGDEILMVYRIHAANYSSQEEYWYNGVRWLRELDRRGAFSALRGSDRADMLQFLAHFGRTATAAQLLAGRRLLALNLYRAELFQQLRDRAWKYLAGTPALACAPQGWIRKAFHVRTAPEPKGGGVAGAEAR